MWPQNRALAHHGSWTDPKSRKTITHKYETTLNNLDKPGPGGRYVSDGDPKTVTKPWLACPDESPRIERGDFYLTINVP